MKKVCGWDFFEVQNGIWISAIDRNGLFRYDFIDKKIIFKGIFPRENMWGSNLHSCILEWQEKLIFIPANAENISIYNLKTETFEICRLPQELVGIKHKFSNAVTREEKLFLFGDQIPGIYILDLVSKQYRQVDKFNIKSNSKRKFMSFINKDYVLKSNTIYLTTRHSGAVYKVNIETENVEKQWIGDKDGGHALICHDGENFWCVENFRFELCCWNEKDGVIERIIIPRDLFDRGGYWTESTYFNGNVLFFQTQNIIFYNIEKKTFRSLQDNDIIKIFSTVLDDFHDVGSKYIQRICAKRKIGDFMYFLTDVGNICRLNQGYGVRDIYSLMSDDWLMEEKVRWLNELEQNKTLMEQDVDSMNIFLECVKEERHLKDSKKSYYGKNISREILQLVK